MAEARASRLCMANGVVITTMMACAATLVMVGGAVAADGGASFDAASFGMPLLEESPKVHGVRWAETRKVRQVVVDFAGEGALPDPGKIVVEYWHGQGWKGQADPMIGDPGMHGWSDMDDWTNGQWKAAQGRWQVKGRQWSFTFDSTQAEFPDLKDKGVTYRKTLQIRLRGEEKLPAIERMRTLTDAMLKPLTVRIFFGEPAEPKIKVDTDDLGYLEIFNGFIQQVRPITGVQVISKDNIHFYILPQGKSGGLEVDLLQAVDPSPLPYDRTIMTVRSKHRPFSFAVTDVAAGQRVLVDDLGMLVVHGEDPMTLEKYRDILKEHTGRSVYDMVFDVPEQTLARSWDDMPLKRPLYFVHGLPGNRNVISQHRDGMMEISSTERWFALPKSPRDSARKGWKGQLFQIRFDVLGEIGGRELREGFLPQVRTWWRNGPVYYESQTVLDVLDGNLSEIELDDPSVLLIKLRVVNTSATEKGQASLNLTVAADDPQKLSVRDDRIECRSDGKLTYQFLFNKQGRGTVTQEGEGRHELLRVHRLWDVEKRVFTAKDRGIVWSLDLRPGESHEVFLAIPSITLDKEEEIEALRKREFSETSERVCAFWKALTTQGSEIITPEPWLNDFYKAHIRHMAVNCWKELDSDILHAHVGSFRYGDYFNESMMMITDLDRRGYHRMAEQCLENMLHYQGTRLFLGNYSSAEGCFYGAGGHESGEYNKSQGYTLWGLAEHWWYTRDHSWMERVAPKIIKGCEFIIRERQATMKMDAQGQRPIEYGFLPTGSLEDVRDYWYWLATNAAASWGFTAAAEALADFGHPEADRLRQEAKAYYDDLMRGWTESRIRCPVVKLRNMTYVPKIPSRLYERGRSLGWLRETLEGSFFLPAYGLLPPEAPETKWILKDYEDNLYISKDYGYDIPVFDWFWFSRGGFSMQSQLLDGPIPYLLRDEIKHYVRAFFNSFTAAYYPEIRMCNEHSLPELGYPVGDHFKSSDEAQATYWLRLMFIHERGGDLYLGQAVPRYWLADGNIIGIERAATHFGPLTFKMTSSLAKGEIKATLSALSRNRPKQIYIRFRHPEQKPIQSVTVNGKAYDQFDVKKEWVILPGDIDGPREIVARY